MNVLSKITPSKSIRELMNKHQVTVIIDEDGDEFTLPKQLSFLLFLVKLSA